MKQAIGTIPLFGLESGKFHDAVLFQGIDLATLQSIEASWTPMFDAAAAENRPEDAHWEWAAKALQALQNPLNYELFGIEADGETQGYDACGQGRRKMLQPPPGASQNALGVCGFSGNRAVEQAWFDRNPYLQRRWKGSVHVSGFAEYRGRICR